MHAARPLSPLFSPGAPWLHPCLLRRRCSRGACGFWPRSAPSWQSQRLLQWLVLLLLLPLPTRNRLAGSWLAGAVPLPVRESVMQAVSRVALPRMLGSSHAEQPMGSLGGMCSMLAASAGCTPFWHQVQDVLHIGIKCGLWSMLASSAGCAPCWHQVRDVLHTGIKCGMCSILASSAGCAPCWHQVRVQEELGEAGRRGWGLQAAWAAAPSQQPLPDLFVPVSAFLTCLCCCAHAQLPTGPWQARRLSP